MSTANATTRPGQGILPNLQVPSPSPTNLVLLSIAAVLAALVYTLHSSSRRAPLPPNAPPLVTRGSWPVVGMHRLFKDRSDFLVELARSVPGGGGDATFWYGRHALVNVASAEARRTFFEDRRLSFHDGIAVFLVGVPNTGNNEENGREFNKFVRQVISREHLQRNLPLFVDDARAALDAIAGRMVRPRPRPRPEDGAAAGGPAAAGVFNVFDDVHRLVFKLTIRNLSAHDIADDEALLLKVRRLFNVIENSGSPVNVILPWMPTPGHARRIYAGARLYSIFSGIVRRRRRKVAPERREDTMQMLIDSGADTMEILKYNIASLFAGYIATSVNAAWLLLFLARDRDRDRGRGDWHARVRREVDAAVAAHRASPSQTPAEVLAALTVDDWEAAFPTVDLCLRETIRHTFPGAMLRRNSGDADVPLRSGGPGPDPSSSSSSGYVVPAGAFLTLPVASVHADPRVYADPDAWDPSRFLPPRCEDQKAPLSYLGWGLGRHVCLGMRFAKLEVALIVSLFISTFDFELVDAEGRRTGELPFIDRNWPLQHLPDEPGYLRYTLRKY